MSSAEGFARLADLLDQLRTELLQKSEPGDTQTTKEVRSSTAAVTSVSDTATNVTLLAANTSRLGAAVTNDSSAALLLKLGATASASSYTARLPRFAYYEVPYGYTGVIDGIWESDPNDGAARIVELT